MDVGHYSRTSKKCLVTFTAREPDCTFPIRTQYMLTTNCALCRFKNQIAKAVDSSGWQQIIFASPLTLPNSSFAGAGAATKGLGDTSEALAVGEALPSAFFFFLLPPRSRENIGDNFDSNFRFNATSE